MKSIGIKSLMTRLFFCLFLALMIQLVCSVSVSQQSSSFESDFNPINDLSSRMRSLVSKKHQF